MTEVRKFIIVTMLKERSMACVSGNERFTGCLHTVCADGM